MKLVLFFLMIIHAFSTSASECLNHDEQQVHRDNIHEIMSELGTCQSNSDCKLVHLGCPFGCGTAVNINYEQVIISAVNEYHDASCSQCRYKCMHRTSIECVNKQCVAK